ncbi:glucosamine-6-phosphate deaminase [Sansalvadorimonas sp. 2012CJ34-2]|uniref:Glucosamine-6-phosphate deaminase n=1 Tax=Parendozoicomonas callyspongiae TaxID=2942213 RepID=A0ABT0PKY4_9GAMM|nr:glucosamine-6-phosphate deaminase [Sansalvadorimonas sp. 2012CJ34-2]MCL6271646.1 glucosamine-6-phosphate deaminase [Sansalvadorimonas sp. 2012CJ34-2]
MQPAFRTIRRFYFILSLAMIVIAPTSQAVQSPFDTLIEKIMMEYPALQGNIQSDIINGQTVFFADTKEAGSLLVSEFIVKTLQDNYQKGQSSVLGLATGSTPLIVYKNLVTAFQNGALSTQNLTTFNLDEYLGLAANHPASYAFFMYQNLFQYLDISDERIHIPSAPPKKTDESIAEYQQLLGQTQRDIQLLGLGKNGHIAFNEPGSPATSRTRLVKLDESTRIANSRYFESPEQVPEHAITMGIADILESKINIIMAWGEGKAEAVKRAITGPISSDCPASFLQQHNKTIWFIDQKAGKML